MGEKRDGDILVGLREIIGAEIGKTEAELARDRETETWLRHKKTLAMLLRDTSSETRDRYRLGAPPSFDDVSDLWASWRRVSDQVKSLEALMLRLYGLAALSDGELLTVMAGVARERAKKLGGGVA